MKKTIIQEVKIPEIMAPAGDSTSLQAALGAGADAVYFGIDSFNMRAGAQNFKTHELVRIVDTCHQKRVKAYLTLNTIIYEPELGRLERTLDRAAAAGIDAVIAWDFAVIEAARQRKIPVFLSTQMSVSNSASLLFFHRNLGIRRFVLARECSLPDIKTIQAHLRQELGPTAGGIELEVFIHGAMCVSMSGRCFMSQFQFDASANRGDCRQPCRREFQITDVREGISYALGSRHVMSPRDLCTLPFLDRILDAGVASLKIEGRGRSPEYVKIVTESYRKAREAWVDGRRRPGFREEFRTLAKELVVRLDSVYNRGFSPGFYLGFPLNEWSSGDGTEAAARKVYLGVVTNYFRKVGAAEIVLESGDIAEGQTIMIQGPTTGVVEEPVISLEVGHKRVPVARKGSIFSIGLRSKVRKGDKVFIMVAAGDIPPVQPRAEKRRRRRKHHEEPDPRRPDIPHAKS